MKNPRKPAHTASAMPAQTNKPRLAPLHLALTGIVLFVCFGFLPLVRSSPHLAASFWSAAGVLILFTFAVRYIAERQGRTLRYEFVNRPVHYIQLALQCTIYAYWGWYWREVYHFIPLILAQIVFVYVFDMLLCWSRRDTWILGFGPFPIVLSTNLFLWFRDDWFWLQFLLICTGVFCKEFLTWNRDGHRTHIFNPSAIALFIFSIGLLLTGTTGITWGEEVSVTLGRPPHIYLEIFVLGLIVQALFSVTLVTLTAAAALYTLNILYTQTTGVYHFVDSNIPIATFVGLHLLVTDPATSPRSNIGKAIFGALYGSLVFAMYGVLSWFGAPTFYDKLLCVPLLNLLVQALDSVGRTVSARLSTVFSGLLAGLQAWTPRRLNFAHMALWIGLFSVMWTTGFISGRHPGSDPEFWFQACKEGRRNACSTWVQGSTLRCQYDSAASCLQLGTELSDGRVIPRDNYRAAMLLGRGCDLGNPYACVNLISLVAHSGPDPLEQGCGRKDGESCFILASLFHAGQGVPKDDARATDLYIKSCEGQWWRGCARLGENYRKGQGVPVNSNLALQNFNKACDGGYAAGCAAAADMYRAQNDQVSAQARLRQACNVSLRYAAARTAYFAPGSASPQTAAADSYCAGLTP